jgi:hypothetical protein
MTRASLRPAFHTVCLAAAIAGSGCARHESDDNTDRATLFRALLGLAERGNAEAQYHVGMMYNNGTGVAKDPKQAFEWFSRASASGDPLGAFKVGCYLGGQGIGVVAQDPAKALEQKLVAATAGYALAQVDVGTAYYEQGNVEEAVKWWTLASDQGEAAGLYNLSVLYMKSEPSSPYRALAYAYFKLAKLVSERQINPRAQASLDQVAIEMQPSQKARADQIVAEWKPRPTAVTLRGLRGIEEAVRVTKQAKE